MGCVAAASSRAAASGDPQFRVGPLWGAGSLAIWQGDLARGSAVADELLALTDGAGSMLFAGLVASSREDEDEAAQLYAECARLAREEGDSWLVSIAVNDHGNSVLKGGEYELALELFEESLAIGRERQDHEQIAVRPSVSPLRD